MCMYVCMCVYICIYAYMHIYIYIHTIIWYLGGTYIAASAIYVSSYHYTRLYTCAQIEQLREELANIRVLVPLCVLIPLYTPKPARMCPNTTIYVSSYHYTRLFLRARRSSSCARSWRRRHTRPYRTCAAECRRLLPWGYPAASLSTRTLCLLRRIRLFSVCVSLCMYI